MTQYALTLPLARTSLIHVPRRDLVLGRADSLDLLVTVVDSDDPSASGIVLTGGIGGPSLTMIVASDSWRCTSWDYGACPTSPGSLLWTGAGAIVFPSSFDVTFPTATMSSWPRRCRWAITLDWNGSSETELLAEGILHLTASVAFSPSPPIVMLTDPTPPVLTDVQHDVILLDGARP